MINDIKTVTIVGGNGVLGKKIAGIFASFGGCKVYIVSRTIEKSESAIEAAALSVKAYSIKNHIFAKTYDDLEKCFQESDLVFESVTEDYVIKNEIHQLINKSIDHECIIATGTSGLSINELSKNYSDINKKKFLGMHFFNPPYNMTLCELIPSRYNESDYINDIKNYLERQLYRDVIIAKDEPGFVANRIGFFFLNEALIYAEKYKSNGGIDYIDSILGKYTGRNMPPIATSDYVGLDVHGAIVNNIYDNTEDDYKNSFILPEYVNELIANNKLGVKVGEGLYKKTDNGLFVYDIETNEYR